MESKNIRILSEENPQPQRWQEMLIVWLKVAATYTDQQKWCKMALHNIASTGKFSTDRTISEYAREIWGIEPGETKLAAPYEE